MKHLFTATILAASIALTAYPAAALDLFGNGLGTAVTGQVGVSSHINNTPVYAPMGYDASARNREAYRRDAADRTVRDRSAVSASQNIRIYPADIAPAAGTPTLRNIPPSARVMGGIQGGYSYND